MITRIWWIIHPYCWSMYSSAPAQGDPIIWYRILAWELAVHARHLELVQSMHDDEALIIYPIGDSEPMRRLIRIAQQTLGERCILAQEWRAVEAEFLHNEPEALRAFLDRKYPEETDQFIHDSLTDYGQRPLLPGLAEALEAEIRTAVETKGYDAGAHCLKVLYHNRVLAIEIDEKLRKAGLNYNPATVKCVASGEGFEQCAMTWKAMLPNYLGLASPIENDFTQSVSGAPFLIGAELRERIHRDNAVRIFLWEGATGHAIALFSRAAVTFGDPQYSVRLPLHELSSQLRDVNNKVVWPLDPCLATNIREANGFVQFPVYAASRQRGDDAYYVLASGIPFDRFRELMVHAEIIPSLP